MSLRLAIISETGPRPAIPAVKGGFADVQALSLDPPDSGSKASAIASVECAREAGADWMIVLRPGEALSADALDLVAPGLGLYDAIFGAAHVAGSDEAVARLSRLAFDEPERLPHALLNWWMPRAHFVRTEVAAATLGRIGGGTRLDYLFDLWNHARCVKSAQPLLDVIDDPQPLDVEARAVVVHRLEEKPVFLPVVHGDAVYHLPYTGRNAGIEREQSRGLFFEAMELEELRKVVKPGAHVVDVGANTGNHTVFFAGPMKAASVLPFEPLPAAAAALRSAVERNGLANVDLCRLGVGVSDGEGRMSLHFSGRGGLGATSLVPDPNGEISVATLDSMVTGPVDLLKIDVEGMEMGVLAGSRDLIRRFRPLIFVEIANRNTSALMDWMRDTGYQVSRIFTDKGHANYLLAPGVAD
ncbi:FkbM family methyltransferase [Mesorhizobium sp. VNQ89]|uniref:FkbM family methyltransferase n=1 Tax=Mesorhizobium quangtriensis TaxID=3157709 RepID=UPI0032B7162D